MQPRPDPTLSALHRLLRVLRRWSCGGFVFSAPRALPSYVRCRPLVAARRIVNR